MKYKIIFFGLLLTTGFGFTLLNSYSQNNPSSTARNTTDKGVVINGVKWATRNVDIPRTFTAKPEEAGMLYQWNRVTAWSATGDDVTDWDATIPVGNTWDEHNDPSPAGWRVPNFAEVQTLFDAKNVTNEWVTIDSVYVRKFTDKLTGNILFLPATGFRNDNHGTLNDTGIRGYYWSSTKRDSTNAYGLRISDSFAGTNDDFRGEGRAIRCVAE